MMHRFHLAAVAAALIALPSVVAQQVFPAAHDKKETRGEDSKRPWTLLLYGAVDNSADDPFVEFTNQVRRAIDDDPGVELILFIDRSDRHAKRSTFLGDDFTSTRLYRLRKNSVERLSGGTHFPEITKDTDVNLNSADASNLQRFISWGKANYPAQRYGLLIYSHADGRAMCPDERSRDQMGIAALSDKLGVKERIDFLALELCNMGGIEAAYEWRPGNGGFEADVLVAIPNAGPPLDWHRAFSRIRSPGHPPQGGEALDPAKMTAADFGKLVIDEGLRGRQASERSGLPASKESAGCYNLRKAGEVKEAVDALAVALAKTEAKNILLELRAGNSESSLTCYSDDGCYVDLYDLCRRLAAYELLPDQVRSAANDVMKVVETFIIASFGMSHYKGFQAGKNGVFIVLPSRKSQFRWYRPNPGSRDFYGNWSFLRDGATPGNGAIENWFELVDSWVNADEAEELRAESDADKKCKDKLQGTWYAVSGASGGQEEAEANRFSVAFEGDEFSVKDGEEVLKGTFKVDSSKDPKSIDLNFAEESDEFGGDTAKAIYKLEGDELTWCVNAPGFGRPKAFTTEEGVQTMLLKLKRGKK